MGVRTSRESPLKWLRGVLTSQGVVAQEVRHARLQEDAGLTESDAKRITLWFRETTTAPTLDALIQVHRFYGHEDPEAFARALHAEMSARNAAMRERRTADNLRWRTNARKKRPADIMAAVAELVSVAGSDTLTIDCVSRRCKVTKIAALTLLRCGVSLGQMERCGWDIDGERLWRAVE